MIGIILAVPVFLIVLMLQTTVVSTLPLLNGTADLVLLVLLAWAVQERVRSAVEWAAIGGVLVGIISHVPLVAPIAGYLAVAILARVLRARIWQSPLVSLFLATFAGSVILPAFTWVALQFEGTYLAVDGEHQPGGVAGRGIEFAFGAAGIYDHCGTGSVGLSGRGSCMNQKNGQGRSEGHWDRWRLWTVYAIIGLIFGVYSLRLFELQIAQGADYHDQADENRRTEVNVQTQRGIIYDRNGIILAQNVPSYNVYIIPAELPGDPSALGDSTALATELDPNVQEVYRRLSELIDMPVSNGEINEETVRVFSPCKTDLGIVQVVFIADTNAPYAPVNIKCGIDEETAMTIRAMAADLPGVGIEVESVRDYPTGSLTATVIGFLGSIPASLEDYYVSKGFVADRDKIGYAGIEATQQDILGGKNGLRVVEVDVSGKELRNLETPIDAVPGNNVSLTIDTRLQGIAQEALVGMINFWNVVFQRRALTQRCGHCHEPQNGGDFGDGVHSDVRERPHDEHHPV